jgi:hypothetical protein
MHISETCVVLNGTSTKRYDEMAGVFLYRICSRVSGDVGHPRHDVASQKLYFFIMEPTVAI